MSEEELFKKYQHFIPYYLHKTLPVISKNNQQYDDYISEGNLYLLKAIRNFDPNQGTSIETCIVCYLKTAYRTLYINNTKHNKVKKTSKIGNYCSIKNSSYYHDYITPIEIKNVLEKFRKLNKREQKVIYGSLWQGKSFTELRHDFGITRQGTRFIYTKAIKRLQKILKV